MNKNKLFDMKIILIIMALALSLVACENQDREFDDFGTTSVYFPFQTPARTLILGNYELGDNENDNNHRFEIGVTMAGVYSNYEERSVSFEVVPELLTGVENVKALPSAYYSIETESPVTIPVGSIKGRIQVQLTDQFFNDTLSFAPLNQVNYVLPLLITEIDNLDSVLAGIPIVINPSRVNILDWEIAPKDFTLYGIKFINKYHAIYLRRGVDKMTNASNETVSSVYHAEYIERDELVTLTTTGMNSVELSNLVRRGEASSPGEVQFELLFNEDGNCTIQSYGDDAYNVSGSGKFVENGNSWGGKERDVIYLDYNYMDAVNNETHEVKDTLVVRNRNVVFEEFLIDFSE
jgi:hypothetical protein